jgi:phospholipid/cholesterol/gamma-HCH transport system substrate-binding protein
MSPNKRNVFVGAVVLGAMVALGWMILKFANQAANFFLAQGSPVVIKAERADGIAEGSAVLYRGIQVGRVRGVRRSPDEERITIDALIDANPPLPGNLSGLIKQTSLLGGTSQILLVPNLEAPPDGKAHPQHLVAGAVLVAEYIPDLSSVADDVRQRRLIEHLDQTVLGIRDQIQKVGVMLDSAQKLVEDPEVNADVRKTIANVRESSENARQLTQKLQKLTDDAGVTLASVDKAVGEVRGTVTDTRGHINKFASDLNVQMDRVASTLERFQAMAVKVDKGEGSAGKLINDPRLYESMADSAAELTGAIKDLRRLIQQWEQEGVPFRLGGK